MSNNSHNNDDNHSLVFSLKAFESFLAEKKRVESLGFDINGLKKVHRQILSKKASQKPTITLDLDSKIIYVSTVENTQKQRSEKIRASGHYFDNKLKYAHPNNRQLSFYDALSSSAKEQIEEFKYEIKAEGIALTPPQNRFMTALNKLLYAKSENRDPNSKEYYAGNAESLPVQDQDYGRSGERSAPVIQIIPAELYKSYLDSDQYSGADIKYIRNLMLELEKKKFLICYDRKRHVKKNGKIERRTDRIEKFESLIQIINYIPDLTDKELEQLNENKRKVAEKKGSYIIAINPILIDQIATKYVEYPADIEKRTVIAAGGHKKVTESDISLRDYMLRELSAKRYSCEINEAKLPYILRLDGYIRNRKKKIIQKRIANAISVSKNLGLIQHVEIEIGKQGQSKYIFSLNPNYN